MIWNVMGFVQVIDVTGFCLQHILSMISDVVEEKGIDVCCHTSGYEWLSVLLS